MIGKVLLSKQDEDGADGHQLFLHGVLQPNHFQSQPFTAIRNHSHPTITTHILAYHRLNLMDFDEADN